jgi:PAS domain S-box-containing protein
MPGVWDAPLFAFPSMNLTQDQYRELLKDLPAAVYVCDAEGKIVFYNDAAVSLWGRTPSLGEEKWCGSSHMRHADGSEIPKEAGPMALAVKNGIALENMEILVERNDGTTRFVSAQPRPIFDEERRVVGGITLLADITDRKAAENAVKESDKRKDEFLGVLAHELRNPLAPLRTGLQLIRLAPNDTNTVENALEVMDRQLQQMVRLIDDLLDVSRISRGKIELHREPVEITSVLKSALEASQPLIEAAGHELNVFTPSEEVFVDADVTRLAQVFSNLLSNAAKYTPKGGHLTLEVTPTRDQIKVSLKDDGVGIPSQMLSKVFDMFTQVDASLDRSQGGLGIGLTLVKSLVEMHNGTVEARSKGRGHGTEFVVTLPRSAASVESAPATKTRKRSQPAGHRILIVDDNKDAALSMEMMLRLAGHETRMAHDGVQTLRVATEFRPNLILLDLGMPKLNGYDTCRILRAQPWGKDVTIAAVTGWGQGDDRERSKAAGFDHHLVKPVDSAAIQRIIKNLPPPGDPPEEGRAA